MQVDDHPGVGKGIKSLFGSHCVLVLLLGGVAVGGCVGTSSEDVGFDLAAPPADEPMMILTSPGQRWHVTIWTVPRPPRKGTVEILYHFANAGGAGIEGLLVSVMPWMPAHGHGAAAVRAQAAFGGDGWYLVKSLALYMSGRWELRTAIEGHNDDGVVPIVDLP